MSDLMEPIEQQNARLAEGLQESYKENQALHQTIEDLKAEMVEQRCLAAAILRIRCCHSCGCTDTQPCEEGCWWVTEDLCSACAEKRGLDLRDAPEETHPLIVRLRNAIEALEAIERGEDKVRILREWRSTLESAADA